MFAKIQSTMEEFMVRGMLHSTNSHWLYTGSSPNQATFPNRDCGKGWMSMWNDMEWEEWKAKCVGGMKLGGRENPEKKKLDIVYHNSSPWWHRNSNSGPQLEQTSNLTGMNLVIILH